MNSRNVGNPGRLAVLAICSAMALAAQNPSVALVHGFSGPDGAHPSSSLIELPDGSLMGSTWNYDASPATGTIYKLDPSGVFNTGYAFPRGQTCSAATGAVIDSGLFQASNGNIYGVCYSGGQYGYGSIYVISRASKLFVIYSFNGSDGSHPVGPLVEGADGNLYGVTKTTVFKISFQGTLTTLYTFVPKSGAYSPSGALTLGSDQNLYGVSYYDGNSFDGGAYRIDTAGSFTTLGHFYAQPFSLNPVLGMDNSVETLCQVTLGVSSGQTVESVSPSGSAHVLFTLPQYYGPDFVNLIGGLVQGGDNALYLNGTSAILSPVYPTLATRIDIAAGTTQFAPVDPSIGNILMGNPLQASSGLIYSAAQTGGPNGFGSVLTVNYGSAAPAPGILFFEPESAAPKTVVTLWGSHFVGATSVTVGGKSVPFTTVASGFIKLLVTPAAKTGPIVVTTPGGTVTSSAILTVQ